MVYRTKDEADAEALAYFEREHQRQRKQHIYELRTRAISGDVWALGQLHMRALAGDPYAEAAMTNHGFGLN